MKPWDTAPAQRRTWRQSRQIALQFAVGRVLRYRTYRLCAYALLIAWPIGIPVGLYCLLWRQWRRNTREFESLAESGDDVLTMHANAAAFNRTKAYARYAFCIQDYRAECFWFEPADMLRKLALSGLLQFVERGTAAQVLLGCCLSFASFGVQIRLLPFREPVANVLKSCAECVLFLTFLVSFIIRVLPRVEVYEPLQAADYGWILVSTLVAFLVLAFALTIRQVLQHRRFRGELQLAATAAGGS
eukprot:COSAG04_NODE_5935_length_1451_cov_1.517751_2_plen_244_part_01